MNILVVPAPYENRAQADELKAEIKSRFKRAPKVNLISASPFFE